jgi:hypothetical protein
MNKWCYYNFKFLTLNIPYVKHYGLYLLSDTYKSIATSKCSNEKSIPAPTVGEHNIILCLINSSLILAKCNFLIYSWHKLLSSIALSSPV